MRGGVVVANVSEFEGEQACFELVDAPSAEGAADDTSVAAGELESPFCARRSSSSFRTCLRQAEGGVGTLHGSVLAGR